MDAFEQSRFDDWYTRHLRALKLQGKAPATVDGSGEPALQYLSRYLYRGVIRENDRVRYDVAQRSVTFRYRDAQSQATAYRTLPLVAFLRSLLQRVLPTGRCRLRQYGFLHGKAKLRLAQVQPVLRMIIPRLAVPRPSLCCPCCCSPMHVIAVSPPRKPKPDD